MICGHSKAWWKCCAGAVMAAMLLSAGAWGQSVASITGTVSDESGAVVPNAEVAITAWSLVFDRGGILIAAELHAPIRQAGGVVASSGQRQLAARLLDFLGGPAGQALLTRYGLFPPPLPYGRGSVP